MQIENVHKDTIKTDNRTILVSTVKIFDGYETMVLVQPTNAELDCLIAQDADQAAKNHKKLVRKYTPKPEKPLTGKYLQFANDLKEAAGIAYDECKDLDDGGTCNFDSPRNLPSSLELHSD